MDRLQIVAIIIFVSRCNLGYSDSTELPTSTTPTTTTPTSTFTTETSTTTTCGVTTCTTTPTTTTCVNLCTTTTPTTTTQTTTETTTTTPKTITHTTAPTTTPTTTHTTTPTITHTTAPTATPIITHTTAPTTMTTPTSTTVMTTPMKTTCTEIICTTTAPVMTTSTMTTPIMTTPMSTTTMTTTCEHICTTTTPATTTQTTTKTTTTITPTIPPTTTTTPMTTTFVETTPTTTPISTVKTSTTPFTTTPVECHMPPPTDCCIRKQLRISLEHVPVVFGKVPYVSVMEQTIGKDRCGCDAKILLNATFQKNSVFDTCQSCTKGPKCGRKMLRIDLEMAPIKTGFSFHVGDSRTNNGYKGDASTQENDAEFHFLGYRHMLYGSDKCPNMSLNMTGLLRNGVTSVTIFIGNEFIRVSNNHGYIYELCSKCLFSLNGQSDSQGPVNENIFISLNRMIDSSSYRDGTGVCSAVIRWACPWDC